MNSLPPLPVVSDEEQKEYERMRYEESIADLREAMKKARKIVFFGGAGVSTESGIPDFRSAEGIYNQSYGSIVSPEVIISRSFFDAHPEDFYSFYRDKLLYLDAKPNISHIRLAEYEKAGKDISVVTQNIDGLHQLAGSSKVYELHGSVLRNYCMKCGKSYTVQQVADPAQPVPRCECGGIIKPDVVLYEERLDDGVIYAAVEEISNCDLLIIAGTSLIVYPAAGLINYFKGETTALINLSATDKDDRADIVIHEKLGTVLSAIRAEDIT